MVTDATQLWSVVHVSAAIFCRTSEAWIIYLQDDCFLHDLCCVILIIYHVYCHCKVFYFENKLDSLFANRLTAALT